MAISIEPRWTIPPDPDSARPISRPASVTLNLRARGDAVKIAQSHTGTVGLLFSDPRPVSRQATKSKNFTIENMRRIKQIQRVNQERKRDEKNRPVKPMFKLDKFVTNASSKVAQDITAPPPAPRPGSASFLRAYSGKGQPSHLQENQSQKNYDQLVIKSTKLSVPQAKQCIKQFEPTRKDVNYLNRNAREAITAKNRKAPSDAAVEKHIEKKSQAVQSHAKGKIPKYLAKRKEQWKREEEERIASMPDPGIPPGHCLMRDAERRETLAALYDDQKRLTTQLLKMPLKCDSYTALNRKAGVERKLAEIDEAIKIFSRPKVYIKEDL